MTKGRIPLTLPWGEARVFELRPRSSVPMCGFLTAQLGPPRNEEVLVEGKDRIEALQRWRMAGGREEPLIIVRAPVEYAWADHVMYFPEDVDWTGFPVTP